MTAPGVQEAWFVVGLATVSAARRAAHETAAQPDSVGKCGVGRTCGLVKLGRLGRLTFRDVVPPRFVPSPCRWYPLTEALGTRPPDSQRTHADQQRRLPHQGPPAPPRPDVA